MNLSEFTMALRNAADGVRNDREKEERKKLYSEAFLFMGAKEIKWLVAEIVNKANQVGFYPRMPDTDSLTKMADFCAGYNCVKSSANDNARDFHVKYAIKRRPYFEKYQALCVRDGVSVEALFDLVDEALENSMTLDSNSIINLALFHAPEKFSDETLEAFELLIKF